MECPDARRLLSRQLTGLLAEAEEEAVREHLLVCAACRAKRDRMRPFSPAPEARARMARAMEAVLSRRPGWSESSRHWALLGLVAAALLLLSVVLVPEPEISPVPTPRPMSSLVPPLAASREQLAPGGDLYAMAVRWGTSELSGP